MTSVWKQMALLDISPYQWLKASLIYRCIGLLGQWREGSWLLQWAEPLAALLISLVLGTAPFVSTSLTGFLLLACTAYWGLLTISATEKPIITPIHLLVLLYWGVATVAVAFSPLKALAFSGWIKLTLYLVLFVLAARILRSPRLTSIIISIFLLVALVVSGYGIRQQIFGAEQLATWNDPTSLMAGDTRVYSFLGNPNLLSGYLLPAIALSIAAVFIWQGWLCKGLAVTMVLVNSACLYFTDSRAGWIGMMVLMITFSSLFYFWVKDSLSPFWQRWLLPMVLGSLGALVVIALLFLEPLRMRVLSIFAGRDDSSNNFRMNVWTAVIKMIKDNPAIGIGPGNEVFKKIYPLYMHPKYSALSSYSIYLETAVEMGIIGLTVFLGLVFTTINQGIKQIKRLKQTGNLQAFWLMAAIAAISALMAQGFADTVWYRPSVHTLWWLMIAIIASHYPQLKKDHSSPQLPVQTLITTEQ
jgi:putative inorganic carbon (HCO3(-)) transporter